MEKHTPTPWVTTLTGSVMQGYSQPFAIAELGKPNLVAGIFGDVHGGEVVAKDNADFIVHAVNCYAKVCELRDEIVAELTEQNAIEETDGDDDFEPTSNAALRITLRKLNAMLGK